jgi:hypothetical protein
MLTDKQLKKDIEEKLSVPLWPHAGQALGLKRGAAYAAAAAGEIVTLGVSKKLNVPTAWLKAKLNPTAA